MSASDQEEMLQNGELSLYLLCEVCQSSTMATLNHRRTDELYLSCLESPPPSQVILDQVTV